MILGAAIFTALLGMLFGGLQGAALFGIVTIVVGLFQLPATIRMLKEEAKRPRAVKYDDAEFHDPEGNLEQEFAAAHIALFLRWCVERNLISEFLKKESGAALASARSGTITYTELLLSHCDGKLVDEELSEEGNRFAGAYYSKGYLVDYSDICGFPNYSCTEAEHDYATISALLDRRFAEFQAGRLTLPKRKPRWWKYWRRL
jgi:hypothetical protein